MAEHIPFISSDGDMKRYKHYRDSCMIRLSTEILDNNASLFHNAKEIWIDPGFDVFHHILNKNKLSKRWQEYLKEFTNNRAIIQEGVNLRNLKNLVYPFLDKCLKYNPHWITVAQLPIVDDASRNQVNKELAAKSYQWKIDRKYKGSLILPVIFTHQNQLKGKTQWRKKINSSEACYRNANAKGLWVVDSDLSDQKCRERFPKRFKTLIEFHEELRSTFPSSKIVAGPYWGMNLILWARGLCDNPAVSLGTSYQYYITGGFKKQGSTKVAVSALRRWATLSSQLRDWLDKTLQKIDQRNVAYREFAILRDKYDFLLSNKDAAKEQLAKSYKGWFDEIQTVPHEGRTLALYQDLSSAYVLGKQLSRLPKTEAPGREAGKVAEQFMLNCL